MDLRNLTIAQLIECFGYEQAMELIEELLISISSRPLSK